MNNLETIDVNVSLGRWPFQRFPLDAPQKLARHLESQGVSLAIVSSVEAILHPDPEIHNRLLFEELGPHPSLLPVAVIDPSLPNWKESLRRRADSAKVRAVKVYPNYHRYTLSAPFVDDLMCELGESGMSLMIQMRVEDERAHYPLMKVPGVDHEAVVELAGRFPGVGILCLCAYCAEAVSLTEGAPNVHVDTSFVECMDTVASVLKRIPSERLLLGSHSPFLYTRSAMMKIELANACEGDLRAILRDNARRLMAIHA